MSKSKSAIDKKKHVPVALPYPYRLPANRILRPVNKQLGAMSIGLIIGQFE
ncbi:MULTISPECIES: hypothetical protein [Vibrio]|nr:MULTISPECIES: hypothetical protein [Vibrio]